MSVLGTGSSDIRMSYLNLLITQLQNQNPLEPMDNNQMAMQLAQLSQLEQMETMSNSFARSLLVQQVDQASGLIGKQVTYFVPGEDTARTGVVNQVVLIRGQPILGVGNDAVDPADVILIQDATLPPPATPSPEPSKPVDDVHNEAADVVPPMSSDSGAETGDELADGRDAAAITSEALAALQGESVATVGPVAAARTYARAAAGPRAVTGLTDALQA